MDVGAYVDIFATKGQEYLLVIGYLLLLVFFWKVLRKPAPQEQAPEPVATAGSRGNWFELAEGRYFHQGHAWAMPLSKDRVRVGLDDFARKLLGRPDAIRLPKRGTRLEQGEEGWQLEFGSRSVAMLSPVKGSVTAVNLSATQSPEKISQDPYGEGWLLEVEVSGLRSNLKNLLTGKLARAWIEEACEALRSRMAVGQLGPVLQDGGVPVEGFARVLSPGDWDKLAAELLMSTPEPENHD